MNKRFLILLIFTLAIISGCEKDDICLSPTTPKLVLRFYNKDAVTDFKKPERLSVIAQSKKDSLFMNRTTDSISIPLNVNTTETIYKLKMNDVDGNILNNKVNTLTIKYTTENIFVSRSCGFKTIFKNVTITSDNVWFKSLTLNPTTLTTINNETSAHVKIFH